MTFYEKEPALTALANMAREDPETADEVAILPFDDDGPAGDAIFGSSVLAHAG